MKNYQTLNAVLDWANYIRDFNAEKPDRFMIALSKVFVRGYLVGSVAGYIYSAFSGDDADNCISHGRRIGELIEFGIIYYRINKNFVKKMF